MYKNYLICYDISNKKRLRKVAKVAYSFALGGQKSALEAPLTSKELKTLKEKLNKVINPKQDRINIVAFHGEPLLYGRSDFLNFSNGVIIV